MTPQSTEKMSQILSFWFSKERPRSKRKDLKEPLTNGMRVLPARSEKETLRTRWSRGKNIRYTEPLKIAHAPQTRSRGGGPELQMGRGAPEQKSWLSFQSRDCTLPCVQQGIGVQERSSRGKQAKWPKNSGTSVRSAEAPSVCLWCSELWGFIIPALGSLGEADRSVCTNVCLCLYFLKLQTEMGAIKLGWVMLEALLI